MKKLMYLMLLLPLMVKAQDANSFNEVRKVDDGLYFMYYDSSASKSVIIEFATFTVLLEVPVKDEGGGARTLTDHVPGGEKALLTIAHYFPAKPLKYVIHSHWHPHSISSVKPFLEKGITLISTRENFKTLKTFVDSATIAQYEKNIQFVDGDSLIISDEKNSLIAYRFTKKDYPSTPTTDYLYSYLPKYNYLHCACMYYLYEGEKIDGKELLTAREEDLYKFIVSKNLKPAYLIRLKKEKMETNDMQPYDHLPAVIADGIKSSEIAKRYLSLDGIPANESRDNLVKEIILHHIPLAIINSEVYVAVGKKDLTRAMILAQLQAMVNPSDPYVWDTIGELYYISGDKEIAASYEKQCKRISPAFEGGGEAAWKTDLDKYQAAWKKLK